MVELKNPSLIGEKVRLTASHGLIIIKGERLLNWPVIKDIKFTVLTILSLSCSIGAIILSVYDYQYWGLLLIGSYLFSFWSVQRATQIMKNQ